MVLLLHKTALVNFPMATTVGTSKPKITHFFKKFKVVKISKPDKKLCKAKLIEMFASEILIIPILNNFIGVRYVGMIDFGVST